MQSLTIDFVVIDSKGQPRQMTNGVSIRWQGTTGQRSLNLQFDAESSQMVAKTDSRRRTVGTVLQCDIGEH